MASSSSFIKDLKGKDQQQTALTKAISNFWDTSDVPPEPAPTQIASCPSIEGLDEERKEELTEAQYEYYNLKRAVLIEKMTRQMKFIWPTYKTINEKILKKEVRSI